MIIKAPRGTTDILPSDIYKWNFIEETARRTALSFGYREIRTPVFEHTELFNRGVGDTTDVVQKEMYTFQDKSNRSITLRPEGTASAARAYLEHSLYAGVSPVKLFYNINCYRYEKPQAGRWREFRQLGVENFGSASPSVDAEVIALAHTIYKNLGIRGLFLNINSIGCPKCRKGYNEALTAYLTQNLAGLCHTCHGRIEKNPMRVLDCKGTGCKEISEDAPSILEHICEDCRAHFEKTKEYLSVFGIEYEIDPSIVRGLDYYTKTVFEFISRDIGAQGTICGGGRYDGLVEMLGGNSTPGIGFASGIERILLVMEAQGVRFPGEPVPDIYLVSAGRFEEVLRLVSELRRAGLWAECGHDGKSLKAQMKNANKTGARYSAVIGDDEITSGFVNIKNMKNGESCNVSLTAEDILCEAAKRDAEVQNENGIN